MHSDAHLDVLRARGQGETCVLKRRHLPLWRAGGVDAVVLNTIPKFAPAAYPYYTSPCKNSLLTFDCIRAEIAESDGELVLVREPADIRRAKASGQIGLLFGVEGAEAIEYEPALLRCYAELGLRVLTLTWHQRNLAADGVHEPAGAGLSRLGRALVREMNRLGVMIDVSHLNPAGIDDVLAISTTPVIASHSNAKALCDNARNIDDERIKAIAAGGGMIGAAFLGRFVRHEEPTLEHVCDHIDHMTRLVGAEYVGLGPDFTDFGQDLILDARRFADVKEDMQGVQYAEGLETPSKLPAITEALLRRNYPNADIEGILGQNFLRLFERVRAEAEH